LLEDGSIADAAPDCGYALVYDDRQGLFRTTLHEGTNAGGRSTGLAVFRATDGTLDPVTAPRAVAPSLDPRRAELYFRVDGTGQAVRVMGTPDVVVEEELPGTACTGPAAAASVKALDEGRRLVVPGVRGAFARADEKRLVVLLGDEASYAPAHAT